MKFHDELCNKIFNGEDLKPEVSEKLLEIADAFIEFLEVPTDAIKDVVITGSMVSYNYTQYSDIDLHLKVDFDKIHKDCPIVQGYLWQSKAMFNKNHDITIYGIPVEVYAESIEEDTVHNGLYSLWQGKWLDFPEKIEPTDNDSAVEAKFNEFKDMADNINDSEEAEALIDKLYIMRKAGLEEVGEFSTENLAFKKVRDAGILERLKEMKKQKIDKELSLESYNESVDSIVIDNYLKMLRDGGHLSDVPRCKYIVQVFTNKELQSLIEFNDVRKAAEKFIEFTDIYTKDEDVVLFKQMRDNGKDIKTIDSTWLNVSNKNEFIKEDYNVGDKITINNKEGVIDSLFKLQDDNSLLGVWIKFSDGVKYYTTKELDGRKNETINKLKETLKKAEALEINEGMWASPFTVENAKQVAELLAKPITYEELNSEEGKQKYWNIIGDDGFWDNVADDAFDIPESDARYLIVKFLEDWIERKEDFSADAYSQKAEDIIKKAIFMFKGITENLASLDKASNRGLYIALLDQPFVKEHLRKSVEARQADDPDAKVGDTIIDSDRLISLFSDKLEPSDYKDFNTELAEKLLFEELHEIEREYGFKENTDEDYASLYDKVDSASSDLKELINELPQFFDESYKDGIYNISTIGKALQIEKEFLDSVETVDGKADSIMSFIIPDGKTIEKTILTKRDKVKEYKPQENEYFLDMVRDTGWWTTDYNLAPMQKLVNRWNGIRETYELEKIIKLALGE